MVTGCQPDGPASEGVPSSSLEGAWVSAPGSSNESENTPLLFFRRDSVRVVSLSGALGWRPFRTTPDSITFAPTERGPDNFTGTFGLAVNGDTLTLSYPQSLLRSRRGRLGPPFFDHFSDDGRGKPGVAVAIRARTSGPRPSRLALSTGHCAFGGCPQFDIEIDSTGLVRYYGRDDSGRRGYREARGHGATFDRLAALASSLALDESRESMGVVDVQEWAVAVWLGGRRFDHDGSAYGGFGNVRLLAVELYALRELADLRPSRGEHTFESRSALGAG